MGYAGGTSSDPTYENLSGAAETVQVDFDPSQVTYEQLVEDFFSFHDATVPAGSTSQYRSVIFVSGSEQEQTARSVLQGAQQTADGPILTQIVSLGAGDFHLAESYHQKYILQTDRTLFEDLTAAYPSIWDLVNSTAAMRVNSYLDGYGTSEQVQADIDRLGLSADGQKVLLSVSHVAGGCPLP